MPSRKHAGTSAAVAGGTLRSAPLASLPGLLQDLGADPEALLQEFGLTGSFFQDPENTLPARTVALILERCAARTGVQHFGLTVGERTGMSAFGAVGWLMQSSPTVGAALQTLLRNFHVHDSGAAAALEVDGKYANIRYALVGGPGGGRDHILDAALAIAFNMLRSLCGPDWAPVAVRLGHRAPRDAAPFRRFFGTQVQFGAKETALSFPAQWLDKALPNADPLLYRVMERHVRDLERQKPADLSGQIRRLLALAIAEPGLSLAAVASRAGLHPRTLNRRLEAEGTTFAALRDEVRRDTACKLLQETATPVGQIGSLLGYADASSFIRAFGRWCGTGPTDWRNGRRQ